MKVKAYKPLTEQEHPEGVETFKTRMAEKAESRVKRPRTYRKTGGLFKHMALHHSDSVKHQINKKD